jgi:hypothetical protein
VFPARLPGLGSTPGSAVILIYFIIGALLVGWLSGGRIERLADVRIRWAGAAICGLLAQVVLFSPPVTGWVGQAGPPLYVVSCVVVLAAVLRNLGRPGIVLLAVGAALNATVIAANGGYMPVAPDALSTLGRPAPTGVYGNTSTAGPGTLLPWLGDVVAVPPPIPLANAISIGDVLIGLGAAVFVVRTMRTAGGAPAGISAHPADGPDGPGGAPPPPMTGEAARG